VCDKKILASTLFRFFLLAGHPETWVRVPASSLCCPFGITPYKTLQNLQFGCKIRKVSNAKPFSICIRITLYNESLFLGKACATHFLG